MGLLGFFSGQIRDLLTTGILTRSGLCLFSFGLFLEELLCLSCKCLLSIIDLLLHIFRDILVLGLLGNGLLSGSKGGGSLRNLLVRRFLTSLCGCIIRPIVLRLCRHLVLVLLRHSVGGLHECLLGGSGRGVVGDATGDLRLQLGVLVLRVQLRELGHLLGW